MRQTLRITLSILIGIVLILPGYAVAEKQKPTFKIGMDIVMSGDVGFIGEGMRDAILMAIDELGDTKYKYELIVEDDELDAKKAANAANKLIYVDKVNAIIGYGTSGPIISPLATKEDIIHFSVAIQPYIAKGYNNFLHWAPSEALNELFIKELQKRGITKVAIFTNATHEGWLTYMENFKKMTKNTDIKILANETFLEQERDFRSIIAKAKRTNPEVVILFTHTPTLEIFAKQMKEGKFDKPITGIETFETTKEIGLFEGYWYVNAAAPSEKFAKPFKARYGREFTVMSPNAYDVVKLIAHVVEKIGDGKKIPPAKKISDELLKINDFPGACGNLSFRENGIVVSDIELKMVKDGEHITLNHNHKLSK